MTAKRVKKVSKKTARKSADQKPIKSPVPYSFFIFCALFGAGLLFIINIQSDFTDFGLDRDEGTYINLGEVLREGGTMYQDAYSIKPPAIFYSYAAINTVFGYSANGLRWSLIVANALGAIMLFIFGYRWKGALFGCVSALAYSFFAFNPFIFGFAALAEHYQNVLLIAGVLALQQGKIKKNLIWYAVAGLLLTYGVLFKQNLVFVYLAIAAGLGWYFLIRPKRDFKPLLYFVGASFITSLLVFSPLLIQGTLPDWIYWNFTYSKAYTASIPWSKGQEYLSMFFNFVTGFNMWMWIAGALGVLIAVIKIKHTAGKIAIALILLASIASIFPGNRFYPHYWSYLSPIMAIGCGWSFYSIGELIQLKIKSQWTSFIPFLFFAFGLLYVVQSNSQFFDSPNELYVNRRLYGDNPFTETRILGEYLKKQMASNDEILMLGSEPEIFTYAGTTTPTPYIFFPQLSKQHERQPSMVAELKNWAETNKPKYAYMSNHPFSWGLSQGADQSLYQWGTSFLNQNYKVIGVADIIKGQAPKILLGDQAATYQLQSQKWVKIYERVR